MNITAFRKVTKKEQLRKKERESEKAKEKKLSLTN